MSGILLNADFQSFIPHTFARSSVHAANVFTLICCCCSCCHISFEREYKIIWFDLAVVSCTHNLSTGTHTNLPHSCLLACSFESLLACLPFPQSSQSANKNVGISSTDNVNDNNKEKRNERKGPAIQLDNYFLDCIHDLNVDFRCTFSTLSSSIVTETTETTISENTKIED